MVTPKTMDKIELYVNSVLIQGSLVFRLEPSEMLAALEICRQRLAKKIDVELPSLLEELQALYPEA